MSAQDAGAMVDSMLRDSPLPNSERVNEEIPEDDGSGKLPEEGEGKKLPEGGSEKQHEETPTGKLVPPCKKGISLVLFNLIKWHIFLLDSQNTGNIVGKNEDVPKRAISEVLASTFQVTSGSGLSREKVKLAVKLLEVSSRILRVLLE